jgi:hypothetical protein
VVLTVDIRFRPWFWYAETEGFDVSADRPLMPGCTGVAGSVALGELIRVGVRLDGSTELLGSETRFR